MFILRTHGRQILIPFWEKDIMCHKDNYRTLESDVPIINRSMLLFLPLNEISKSLPSDISFQGILEK